MGVTYNFTILCNNLTVEQITRSTISSRYERITKQLNNDFWGILSTSKNSLYVGSYGRGTAVRGFSDLDILFILPSHLYSVYKAHQYNGQSALLQAVKKSLQKTYLTTDIGGDGQVVTIKFTDGIKFEVIPAFLKTDGSFYYPDSNSGGTWKTTNPTPEINIIKNNNKLTNENLVNLCRMARAWRSKCNVPIGGLLIDTLANNFIISWEYKDKSYTYYDWMSRDFFKYVSDQDSNKKYWLASGSCQQVYRQGNFEYKAKQCYDLALDAIKYQSMNMNHSANQKWREIYGAGYPNQSN
jgi:Second Messenger Oligonucleotide or Dinucleotide Synthetase domain